MGKSSGGSAPGGSQTIIQDIAEPFKGFAVRSLQRAEDLQGLPAVPFTGIATAPPSPDELVGAQALRDRFMEHGPLSTEALALQRTAADPITAASIQARQSPFEALLAQEAYRRQDERTQRDLQKQRAREVASGGFDRGRGAIEEHLIRQRAEDQERQIGLEAGQRAFTDAAQLAQADRRARAQVAEGLLEGLTQRQALGRRDIDDLIKVGAQFREQFVQPELNLERQQFGELRGPGSVMNPFGFEQFFSGIRSAAPTPGITTTQQFKQTPSGLGQIAPIIGGGLSAAQKAGLFERAEGGIVDFHEGGEINFDEGGIASFARGRQVNINHREAEAKVLSRLNSFFDDIENNSDSYSPEIMAKLKELKAEFIRNTRVGAIASGSFAERMRYYEAFLDAITNIANPGIPTKGNIVTQRDLRRGVRSEAPRLDEFIPHGPDEGGLSRLPFEPLDPDERGGTRLHTSRDYPALRHEGTDMRYPARTFEESLQEFKPAPEAPRQYSDAEITGMLEFATTGRRSDRVPKGLMSLNQTEMIELLKPLREKWRENSKERREKERRERIANRRSFNRNSFAPRDTGSFDFDFSDVKEFFGFKEGGIASFANGKDAIYSDRESTFNGKPRETTDLGNYQTIKALMVAAGLDPGNMQDVAKYMGEDFGKYALIPGYPGRSEELTKAEDKYRTKADPKKDVKGAEDANDKPDPSYTNKLMDMYTAFLNEKRTPGYPDRPPLSESQRRSAIIRAIAGALQEIRDDRDTGMADFSGMGAGASSAVSNYMNELETRRKEEIAAREARSKAILEGVKTTYEMHQALAGAQKDRADAAVKLIEAQYPGLPIYDIIAPPLLKGIAEGTLGVEEFQAAVAEAVKTLTGKTGTAPGIISEEVVKDALVTQGP